MESETYTWAKLLIENVSLLEVAGLLLVLWLLLNPSVLDRFSSIKVGALELKLRELEAKQAAEAAELKAEIAVLETEVARTASLFGEAAGDFDANAPLETLAGVRESVAARARSMDDPEALRDLLGPDATAEELYVAAVALRSRRPPALFGALVDCLDRLARHPNLHGIRLNTIWTLTSALHRIAIATIRDQAPPHPGADALRRALEVLDRLDAHPRVLADRPDDPDAGVKGPVRHARRWIEEGLAAG